MSRSYRKPYYTWTSAGCSAHHDKTTAARGMRRAQNQSLREAIAHGDWDGWLIPVRGECTYNNVYSWHRDGKQFPFKWRHNDFNPYWLHSSARPHTDEELVKRMNERIADHEDFLSRLRRK